MSRALHKFIIVALFSGLMLDKPSLASEVIVEDCNVLNLYTTDLLKVWTKRNLQARQSAVEMELPVNLKVIRLIDTLDGTLRPLLWSGDQVPDFVLQKARKRGLASDPKALPFEDLDPEQRKELVAFALSLRTEDFWENRKIAGLKVVDTLRLTFDKPVVIFGKRYLPGTHSVPIGKRFSDYVEATTPETLKNFGMVELHIRDDAPAGDVLRSARNIQVGLKVPLTNLHLHSPARIPMVPLRTERELTSLEIADHHRRTNNSVEMRVVVDAGADLSHSGKFNWIGEKLYTFRDSLRADQVQTVYLYLKSYGTEQHFDIGTKVKMASVAFRGSDSYDEPGLIGYEHRRNAPEDDIERGAATADAAQHYLQNYPNVNTHENFRAWWAEMSKRKSAEQAAYDLWYNQPWYELFSKMPAKLKSEIGFLQKMRLALRGSRKQKQVKMLIHNWSDDPMLFRNTARQEQIIDEQVAAIRRVKSGEETYEEAVISFLKATRLGELFDKTLSGA